MLLVTACCETCEVIILSYINFTALNCDLSIFKCNDSKESKEIRSLFRVVSNNDYHVNR